MGKLVGALDVVFTLNIDPTLALALVIALAIAHIQQT